MASRLLAGGFSREVAGKDFDRIVKGAEAARENRIGLLLAGATGSGKTFAMRCLYPRALFVSAFDPTNVDWLEDSRLLTADERHIIIDDLGSDAIKNQYGVWTSPLALFIMRAESAKSRGTLKARIHFTTNLSSKALDEIYGDRVVSRLLSLVVPVRLLGGDHRPRYAINFDE